MYSIFVMQFLFSAKMEYSPNKWHRCNKTAHFVMRTIVAPCRSRLLGDVTHAYRQGHRHQILCNVWGFRLQNRSHDLFWHRDYFLRARNNAHICPWATQTDMYLWKNLHRNHTKHSHLIVIHLDYTIFYQWIYLWIWIRHSIKINELPSS